MNPGSGTVLRIRRLRDSMQALSSIPGLPQGIRDLLHTVLADLDYVLNAVAGPLTPWEQGHSPETLSSSELGIQCESTASALWGAARLVETADGLEIGSLRIGLGFGIRLWPRLARKLQATRTELRLLLGALTAYPSSGARHDRR